MSACLDFSQPSPAIGELVFNNPEKRNALSAEMWDALPKILHQAQSRPELKVLIVRGEGEHFASGADISEFATLFATKARASQASAAITQGMTALANFPLPTIAQIRGSCVGGGCGLALCCDVRFADDSAKFAITPAKLGLVYPFEDVQRLIETVGIPIAKDMLFSARVLDAQSALSSGLINGLFAQNDLNDSVQNYAQKISHLSRESNTVTKAMFKAYQQGQRGETTQTTNWFVNGFDSDDFKEGFQAFLDKRTPEFK